MNLISRVIPAFAVLTAAAIPVAALTVKNTSSNEVSIAVDNGSTEGVYKIPAGGSVDATEDCSSDCAVTGPWGYSRLVAQNATIETDGTSLVTANAAPAQALVPQNPDQPDAAVTAVPEPVTTAAPEPAAAAAPAPTETTAPAAETAPAATAAATPAEPAPAAAPVQPRRKVAKRKAAKQAQKGPGAGSFEMLFQGPGK
jgi:hypothetical protein